MNSQRTGIRAAHNNAGPSVLADDDEPTDLLSSPTPRLVVISNRVPHAATAPGGLAAAMQDALSGRDSLWFGWSGETTQQASHNVRFKHDGRTTYALTDICDEDYAGYYEGFANRMLWPAFHYRLDLSRYAEADYTAYRRVNRQFAQRVAPLIRPDDLIWIHDYHLIPLAAELRQLGIDNRIGFFSHIPFPSPEVFHAIPHHHELIEGFAACNLVGFQSARDRANFERYVCTFADGFWRSDGRVCLGDRIVRAGTYPIGIDAEDFRNKALAPEVSGIAEKLSRAAAGRKMILGVDRMDYSKGLPERVEAMEALFRLYPELVGECQLIQVAPVSRGGVEAYAALRQRLETAVGHVNGAYSTLDWSPVRFVAKAVPRNEVAAMMRVAKVALVTPLRDGMNLVAKEYVAAQDPDDPGVLVLSEFAGAAEQLSGALVINPHNPDDQARAIARAVSMPRAERVARYWENREVLAARDANWWSSSFLADLESASVDDFTSQLMNAVQTSRAAE
ncbi:alpha,alpha-trehalose-phosphate synthase (UDP-forming) [Henriciella aquimarina]|uniref:alpha,alpha-trehalose-phosphate synthase (UDP-forming) n=1 Tax=Henriciella aquimarina TaxID=545261 RepID=UPI000A072326|nr:trehalose-6-phosphate synthase [Henriciella aquimarina]